MQEEKAEVRPRFLKRENLAAAIAELRRKGLILTADAPRRKPLSDRTSFIDGLVRSLEDIYERDRRPS